MVVLPQVLRKFVAGRVQNWCLCWWEWYVVFESSSLALAREVVAPD